MAIATTVGVADVTVVVTAVLITEIVAVSTAISLRVYFVNYPVPLCFLGNHILVSLYIFRYLLN